MFDNKKSKRIEIMKRVIEKSILEYLNTIDESSSNFQCLSRIAIKIVEKEKE